MTALDDYDYLRPKVERLELENGRLRAALRRAEKFIWLGNHPNAGDMLDEIERALAQG